MSEYSDLSIRSQILLERLKSGIVLDFNRETKNLEKEMRAVMAAIEKPFGDLSRTELNRLLVEMRQVHTEVMGSAMLNAFDNLPAIAALSVNAEKTILKSLLPKYRFNVPTAKVAYKYAIDSPIQATGGLLEKQVATWSQVDMRRIEGIARTSWAQGQTTEEAIKKLIGTSGQKFGDGELFKSRGSAASIIQTATQHTANASRQSFYEDNSELIKGYIWVSTLDRRTTTQCKSLDGRRFLAGKGPMPPIHINCRSTTIAWMDEEFDFLNAGGTRASQFGYTSSDENYYDWLKRQPRDFQVLAMGERRTKLFRDGGLTVEQFRKLNIDKTFAPLSLAEMKKLAPQAFAKAGLN